MDHQSTLFGGVEKRTYFDSLFNGPPINYTSINNKKDIPRNLIPMFFVIEIRQGYLKGKINVSFFQQSTKRSYSVEEYNSQYSFFKINPGYSKDGFNMRYLLQLYLALASLPQHTLSSSPFTYILQKAEGNTIKKDDIDKLLRYLDQHPENVSLSLENISSKKSIDQILKVILDPFVETYLSRGHQSHL